MGKKDQTKLTRCRIGHTRLTHSYILKNKQAPFCIPCNEPLTIKHILISFIDLNHIRTNYYQAQNIKDLFNNTSDINVLEFLKEINIFSKL